MSRLQLLMKVLFLSASLALIFSIAARVVLALDFDQEEYTNGERLAKEDKEKYERLSSKIAASELEIEKENSRLESRRKEMKRYEVALRKLYDEVVLAREELKKELGRAKSATQDDLGILVELYERMKIKDAVRIFEIMEPKMAAGILSKMDSEIATKILGSLESEKSYAISAIIAGRSLQLGLR